MKQAVRNHPSKPYPAPPRSNPDSGESSSDMDSLTEDLDSIGRFNLPKLSDYWTTDSLPSLPTLPSFPQLPQLPPLANIPGFSSAPTLAEVSRLISQYVNSATAQKAPNDASGVAETDPRLVNSLKTSLATRIQINTFLSDLRNGSSLQAALERLRPITDVIHEAVTLPADESDEEPTEPVTEPEGVGAIVNREQPFVNELVAPDGDEIGGVLGPTSNKRRRRRAKHVAILSDDDSMMSTDLDTVEELTRDEARVLTHLDSLDDFFKEDLLRQKIQSIQRAGLSQHSKNKLVTKLMMGNYYRYIEERRAGSSAGNSAGMVEPESTRYFEKVTAKADTSDPKRDITTNPETSKSKTSETLSDQETPASDSPDSPESDFVDEDEVVLSPEDITPTYHNQALNILGCAHYQRNCKVECPTCLKWFTCRFCHDAEVPDHRLVRSEVRHILCMRCSTPQVPETNYCVNCEEELANYFCEKCVLYDNDTSKDIYHCDRCGICRLGLGLGKDYFHCDTCNICLSIELREHHKCVTNTTHSNCPICNEYLFTSVNKVVFMKCGHSIHQACYDEMIKHSYKCPMCKKTVVNTDTQFRILDQEIRQSPLPPPYDKWRCIINCNDCKGKSNCAYHVLGLKCKYCNSYNTNQLKIIKPEEAEESDDSDEAGENERITSMRLIKTTLSSNFLIDESETGRSTPQGSKDNEEKKKKKKEADSNPQSPKTDPNYDLGSDSGLEMGNLRKLTKALLGDSKVDRTSISNMFQNFINQTVTERDSDSDMGTFGGF